MNKQLIWTVIAVLIGISGQVFAATDYYVDASRPDNSGDGTSWATAKRDIQAAVDLLSDNDKIWVTNGIYDKGGAICPTIAGRTTSTMSNRVCVSNEYITIEAVNKGVGDTVIVGAPDPGTGDNGPNAVRCVYGNRSGGDKDYTVWLDGFTLSNGYTKVSGDAYLDKLGGGIHSARATNCWIVSNHGAGGGAGMAYAKLYNCRVFNNVTAGWGGAGYAGEMFNCTVYTNQAGRGGAGHATIFHDCVISNNYATRQAGAMRGDAAAYDCLIVNNHATSFAGVMEWSCIASNCVIRGNRTGGYGSVIAQTDVSRCYLYNCLLEDNCGSGNYGAAVMGCATLVNCTIVSNRADTIGSSAGLDGYTKTLFVTNCIIYGNINTADGVERNYTNVTEMSHCLTTPDPTGESYDGGGNITGDPLFVDATGGDYHLTEKSPAVDAGTSTNATRVDLDGIIRPQDGNNDGSVLYDIGCYEHVYVPPVGMVMILK